MVYPPAWLYCRPRDMVAANAGGAGRRGMTERGGRRRGMTMRDALGELLDVVGAEPDSDEVTLNLIAARADLHNHPPTEKPQANCCACFWDQSSDRAAAVELVRELAD